VNTNKQTLYFCKASQIQLLKADTQQQQIVVVGAGVPSQTAIEERQEINADYGN